MSAGTGVMHSEFNASKTAPVHFLQIWIVPAAKGIAPGYEQKHFSAAEKRGRLRLVGSRDGREGSVTIHQDASLYAALLDGNDRVSYELPEGRKGWVQIARGAVELNGVSLEAGDGVALQGPETVTFSGATGAAELLLFYLG